MGTRMIRDGLMDSERVCKLPVEARWLFLTICLTADDVGCFDAAPFALMRKAELQRDLGDHFLTVLADADLIRLYTANGKRFGFIPRFGQRLQITRLKHPAPPTELLRDDPTAASKINKLRSIPASGQTQSAAIQTPEAEAEAEVEAEFKLSGVPSEHPRRKPPASDAPACPYAKLIAAYHEVLPELPAIRIESKGRKAAIRKVWSWVFTSLKPDKSRRATTVAEGVDWFRRYFEQVRHNDFLMGRGPKTPGHENWQCSLDYLLTERGMRQVIERTKAPA